MTRWSSRVQRGCNSYRQVVSALVTVLLLTGMVAALAPSAQAEQVGRSLFWRSLVKQAAPFTNPSPGFALESTARLTWASAELGDPVVLRTWFLQNPDGSEEFSAKGGPIGDARGVCTVDGSCWLSMDGGATWMTGQKPKGDINTLADQYAVYDPLEWSYGDLPDAMSYDITGSTYTITIDSDSTISIEFGRSNAGRRQMEVRSALRDADANVRAVIQHELVRPRPVQIPR